MREIKFRGWNKSHKQMVYKKELSGYYGYDTNAVDTVNHILNYDNVGYEFMQYTGLKDKNGKEIYEGDIIKHHNGVDDRINKVSYVNGCFVVCSVKTPNRNLYLLETYYSFVEVIGNIYENPELSKE